MNLEVKDNGILQIESILMKDFLMPHYDHNKNVFTIHVWGSFFTCVCLWFFWGEGEGFLGPLLDQGSFLKPGPIFKPCLTML